MFFIIFFIQRSVEKIKSPPPSGGALYKTNWQRWSGTRVFWIVDLLMESKFQMIILRNVLFGLFCLFSRYVDGKLFYCFWLI